MNARSTLRLHATAVAIDGAGLLLCGDSGCGKSDLALRLVDGGGQLVADDQVELHREGDRLMMRCPAAIAGKLEVRGIGIIDMPASSVSPAAPVVAAFDLAQSRQIERLPEPAYRRYLDIDVPLFRVAPFEASAAAKIRLALRRLDAASGARQD